MKQQNQAPVVTHIISGDLWAGAEVQVYNLCLALQASGKATVTAVVFNTGILYEKLLSLGVPVSLADEKKLGPWAMAKAIARHCRNHHSRIVHTHGFKENVLGIIGKDLARIHASVRTVHGNPEIQLSFSQPHKWLISKLDILLGRSRQQAVIAVSSQLEQKLRSIFPGKVLKICNFLDVENLRTTWGIGGSDQETGLRFGIVGRLVPVKRVDLFIETIALLNERGMFCDGIVVGNGPLEDDLRALASRRGVADRVTFRGFVDPVHPELKTFRALLMTSDHEGLPMTLLEALALEVPIVAHNTGGIPEVLSHGAGGWLVDDHSPTGYANALQELIDSPQTVTKKTQSGLETVQRLFDRTAQTEKYLEIYRALG
ncbi:glycosyltransferase [uncultured Marinobacter sp.]|uniref:glycosyltransferase n=1 Tax=uncultured Marinobacter sp. TaxID=187379 RepID=UPI002603FE59|nr:glycosyltransferase [uncultured Marinobacter sp.]